MQYLGQVMCRTAQDNALEGLRSIYARRNEDIYLGTEKAVQYEIDLREKADEATDVHETVV